MANRNDDLWPYDIAKLDGDNTTFNWKVLTVDRVFDGQYGYGLKFVEDEEKNDGDKRSGGNIWNLKGAWAEAANPQTGKKYRLPYTGHKYKEGDKVEVQLTHRTYPKANGEKGEERLVNSSINDGHLEQHIRLAGETSQPSQQAEPAVQGNAQQAQAVPDAEPRLTTDQKIARAQALNIIKDLLIAGIVEPTLNITEAVASQIVRDETLRLALGKHVSLDYLSPMVQVGIELDGTVTEIKNKPSEDEAGDTVETLDWNTGESTTTV